MKRIEFRMLIDTYRAGVDDGFSTGIFVEPENLEDLEDGDALGQAYREGYDHGVRLYCETIEGDAC